GKGQIDFFSKTSDQFESKSKQFMITTQGIHSTKIAKENPQVPSLSGPDLVQFTTVAADLRKRLSLLDSVNTAAGPSLPSAKPNKTAKP
ncbi:MAG: hypothetical protein EBT14_04200, partial [Betaproteobacteria bacterium]|nr:hypothetical protein [Betaproteobacteria bacterium]